MTGLERVPHAINLRASVPLPWGSYYVTILVGRERRSTTRLEAEGQTRPALRILVYFLMGSIMIAGVVCALVLLYLVKSALGIDLMSGDSPAHFIYELVFGRLQVISVGARELV
jgi:hypothetical protein